jgi:hypothetical protein
MMESTIIQERRCLLQQQQYINLPAVKEEMQQLDNLCDETVHADLLDQAGSASHEDSASGLSFALEGAHDFRGSRPYPGSSAVGDHLCSATSSDPDACKAIFSDHSVVVQTQPQSRSSTSKLRAKLRDIMAAHRRLQDRTIPHEPPALFQGLVGL